MKRLIGILHAREYLHWFKDLDFRFAGRQVGSPETDQAQELINVDMVTF